MRRFVSLLALCGGLLAAVCTTAPSSVSAREPGQEIIRCGQQTPIKGSPRFFTGTVRIDPLYAANNAMRSSGGSVTFEPGSRSHWHIHPVGQVLIVTAGVGLTQEWGKPIQEIRAGDVVICPAKVKHWHGAAPGSAMTHISICEETEPGLSKSALRSARRSASCSFRSPAIRTPCARSPQAPPPDSRQRQRTSCSSPMPLSPVFSPCSPLFRYSNTISSARRSRRYPTRSRQEEPPQPPRNNQSKKLSSVWIHTEDFCLV